MQLPTDEATDEVAVPVGASAATEEAEQPAEIHVPVPASAADDSESNETATVATEGAESK